MPVTQALPIFLGAAGGSVRTQTTALTQRRPYFSFAQAAFPSACPRARLLSRPLLVSIAKATLGARTR
jgi:hypothetical protein